MDAASRPDQIYPCVIPSKQVRPICRDNASEIHVFPLKDKLLNQPFIPYGSPNTPQQLAPPPPQPAQQQPPPAQQQPRPLEAPASPPAHPADRDKRLHDPRLPSARSKQSARACCPTSVLSAAPSQTHSRDPQLPGTPLRSRDRRPRGARCCGHTNSREGVLRSRHARGWSA